MISSLGFSQPTTNSPTTNAPTPAHGAADVISVYSDAYTTNVGTNYNPFWGQSGAVNTSFNPTGSGSNLVMAYTNFNYQGTEVSTQNASSMEYIHIDIWTADATVVKFSPINNGTGAGEYLVNVPLVNGGWSSVDLPKSAFVGMNWDSVIQMKFDGQAGVSPSNIYLDNIYFWKTSSLPLTAPITNAPTPTQSALDVISVYSDTYTTNVGTNYNPFWGQSGSVNTTYNPTGSGSNYAMAYTNFNYQGTEVSTQNASSMDYIHIDIWTADATVVKFSPINNGTGAGEYLVSVPLVAGGWSSVDLPKSAFVGMTWDSVIQMKFDGQAGVSPSNIYLDNIYFWKTASLPLTAPITDAPTPTHAAADVVSVYSDAYTTNVGTDYNPNWGQTGSVNTTFSPTGSGSNYAMAYTNFNYQGTYLTQTNASDMEYLHIDIWTANATSVKVSPINNGTGVGEYLVNVPLVNAGWSSVDLPKSAFVGMNWDSVFQMKFDGQSGVSPSTIYLDNIYFWKTASPSGTPVIGNFIVPAKNLGDLPFSLTAPTSDSPGAFSYTSSNLSVATISGNTVTIVGAGTSTITATQAASGSFLSGFKTADLVVTEVPLVAAPNPPARNAWDVISLYSNAYSNMTINDWSAGLGWGGLAPITDLQISGNDTKKIAFGNFIGVDFGAGNHIDATNMTTFHMDFWMPSTTDLTGKVLNPKFSEWTSDTSGETSSFLLTYLPSVNGSWVSIDAPLSTFTSGNSNPNIRNNVAQFLISSNLGVVYLDNIYLYRAPTMTTDTFNATNVKLYPNPTSTSLTIEANDSIESIAIYNLLGQEVTSKNPMSNSVTMDVSNLENGLYFVNSTIDGKTSTTKFIKN